jgi:hypothetical protein
LGIIFIEYSEALIGRHDEESTNFFKRSDGVTTGDGGFSVALNDKRVLWLFGDCHINDLSKIDGTVPCLFQARNAAMVQPSNDWNHNDTKTLIGANTHFESLFKATDDSKQFYWPGHGIQIQDTVYVYCVELENTAAGGNLGFRNTDNDHWCEMKMPELKVSGYKKLPNFNGIDFGAGFIDNGDGNIYAYGQKTNGKMMGRSLYLAKFSRSQHDSDWDFWDGKMWVKDVHKAHPLLDDQGNTMSVNKVKNKYLVLSTEFSIQCDQGKTIYARLSDYPHGPFSEKKAIHVIDEAKYQNHYPFFYMAISHPELINSKNELLITYSINNYGPCLEGCPKGRMNPDHYRLRGVRVPIDELFKLH